MYDKIIHISLLFTLIYEKFLSIRWLISVRHKFYNYEKVKDYFIIQRFVTYTSLGNNLAILCSFYSLIFNTRPEIFFFILTWNTLFCVTLGYWLLVFPKSFDNKDPTNYFTDFLSHGPALFFYSLLAKYYNIFINFEYAVYPLFVGYFYLFCIWYPWYKTTGDTIYVVMDYSWKNRIYTILTMNLFSILGHFFYIYLFNF